MSGSTAARLRGLFGILAVNLAVFLALLVVAEIALQGVATVYPAYASLPLEPDRDIGWKFVPDLQFVETPNYWYAREYSTEVTINDAGFRDYPRTAVPPEGTGRVAILGDSMIAALHVPLADTASARLETLLGESSSRSWEVLNFGVPNFSVGQFLLTWEHHASRYQPDIVVVLVAEFMMQRTVHPFRGTRGRDPLSVRPTFALVDGALVHRPAADFDAFVEAQLKSLGPEPTPETRSHRVPRRLITPLYAHQLWRGVLTRGSQLVRLVLPGGTGFGARAGGAVARPDAEVELTRDEIIEVNLEVLAELARRASSRGARLVVADASDALDAGRDDAIVAGRLRSFCEDADAVYVAVSPALAAAEERGVRWRWRHDGHFNVDGNRILAAALHEALVPLIDELDAAAR